MSKAATHERLERREEIEVSSDRSFGLVFTAVFIIIGLLPVVFGGAGPRWWSLVIAAAFLALALIRPSLLAPLNRVWLRFGLLLHKVVNPLVMGLIFYIVITPVGVVMRLCGRDVLRLKSSDAPSYWIERVPPGPKPETMSNQF